MVSNTDTDDIVIGYVLTAQAVDGYDLELKPALRRRWLASVIEAVGTEAVLGAARRGRISLARCDLPQCYPPDLVAASELTHPLGATFHTVAVRGIPPF